MDLELTGERTAPGVARENYWFRRHEIAYHWAAGLLPRDSAIVDAGSGEGYGADLLARELGSRVIALEYDEQAASHSALKYPDLLTVRANLAALPLAASSADAVVSMQVIEHLWSLAAFVADVRRALVPGGVAILATPNRLTFSPGLERGAKPTNPFHVEEFDAEQVLGLVSTWSDAQIYGVHHRGRLQAWEREHGSIVAAQVRAVLDDAWGPGLEDAVSAVTLHDFAIEPDSPEWPINASLDLIVVARA